MTPRAAARRINSQFHTAIRKAPAEVRSKWHQITSLRGKRGSNIGQLKKEFTMQWVSDPEWSDAYFSQQLSLSDTVAKKKDGTWVTKGRLEQLIGVAETETAINEKWWDVKKGTGTQVLIFYTEYSMTRTQMKAMLDSFA